MSSDVRIDSRLLSKRRPLVVPPLLPRAADTKHALALCSNCPWLPQRALPGAYLRTSTTRDFGEKGGRALCPAIRPAEAGQHRSQQGPRAVHVKKSSVALAQPLALGGYRSHSHTPAVPAEVPAFSYRCRVLLDAVRMVSETPARRERRPVRILDAPCGDFTWMPGCLERIRAALGVKLYYTGADIVPELVAQLNAGRGHLLVDGTRASVGEGIRAEWIVLDQSDTAAMLNLKRAAIPYDIIISKHMFIHLQSEARRANRTARSVRHSGLRLLSAIPHAAWCPCSLAGDLAYRR